MARASGKEDLEKKAEPFVTEEYLRTQVRLESRGRFREGEVRLPGEVLGIACYVTGTDDPAIAIQELVEAALGRWARQQIIERMVVDVEPRRPLSISKSVPAKTAVPARKAPRTTKAKRR